MHDFDQYHQIIAKLAAASLAPAVTQQDARPHLGLSAARLLLEDDAQWYKPLADGFKTLARLGKPGSSATPPAPRLTDGHAHHREVYHPLTLHMHLRAFCLRQESLPAETWGACETAMPEATASARCIERYAQTSPPLAETALTLWRALVLLDQSIALARDVDTDLIDCVVHQIVNQPGPDGALHPRPDGESLDVWTYRELSGLHALAGLAVTRRNRSWAQHVQRIGLYHTQHTQPDHTTDQPWGLFAFLWSPQTRGFAEQQLHDLTVSIASSSGSGEMPSGDASPSRAVLPCPAPSPSDEAYAVPVTGMLLADATHTLAQFIRRP